MASPKNGREMELITGLKATELDSLISDWPRVHRDPLVIPPHLPRSQHDTNTYGADHSRLYKGRLAPSSDVGRTESVNNPSRLASFSSLLISQLVSTARKQPGLS